MFAFNALITPKLDYFSLYILIVLYFYLFLKKCTFTLIKLMKNIIKLHFAFFNQRTGKLEIQFIKHNHCDM